MKFSFPMLRRRLRSPRIPILSYHGLHAPGKGYADNDHVALEQDLLVLRRLGFRVAPLAQIARLVRGANVSSLYEGKWAGLSFDDGTDHDYFDLDHPHLGYIKSFFTILKESALADPASWPPPTGVSFVIASPEAREILDRTCIAGQNNWRDVWWKEAARTNILQIGNHSWDHTHPTLPTIAQREQRKGTFFGVDTFDDAEIQIAHAEQYIRSKTGGLTARLFAYPYGEASEYLKHEYFPRYRWRHRQLAAFTIAGDYATADSDRWSIPRFMCGLHWKSPEELEAILARATTL